MAKLVLKNIQKWYGENPIIKGISLDVMEGEFITLLGPSGCGKTTTLRMIAGFISPDEGDIYFDDIRVNDIAANKRSTAMVFQSYALFPHMTVWQNISFGLRMLKMPKDIISDRVKRILDLVDLNKEVGRYPRELSGGQQQRVALGRALVMQPQILLLDEPLSNLDAKLREKMRIEIRELQKKLGLTAIYVTHDQNEALVISDRIVVMDKGEIQQIDTPEKIYNAPKSSFVADFIGSTNFIRGIVHSYDKILQQLIIDSEIGELFISTQDRIPEGTKLTVSIRPENIELVESNVTNTRSNTFESEVIYKTYMGNFTDYHMNARGSTLRVQTSGNASCNYEDKVFIHLDATKCRIVDIFI